MYLMTLVYFYLSEYLDFLHVGSILEVMFFFVSFF